MKTISQIKSEGLAALKGNWIPAVIVSLIYTVVALMCISPNFASGIFHHNVGEAVKQWNFKNMLDVYLKLSKLSSLSSFLAILVVNVLQVGLMNSFLHLYRNNDNALIRNMLSFSLKGYFHKVLGMLYMRILLFFWTLLLVIPGIIKTFSYAMTPYILNEYPDLGLRASITMSRKMMHGHKLDLLVLQISFLGWALVSLITFGIGLLWLIPYMQTSMAVFYEDVKAEYFGKYDPVQAPDEQ